MYPRRVAAALALALACGSIVACGDDGDSGDTAAAGEILAGFASLDGPLSDELIDLAETEGQLSIYTSNSDLEDLVAAFEDRFDIRVDLYRANSETVVQRTMQEDEAGRLGADVIESLLAEMELLSSDDLFVPYAPPLLEGLRPEARFPTWTATRFNAFVVAWNTEVLGDVPPPTTWTQLAEEPWASLVALEVGDFDWYLTLHRELMADGMSSDEVDAFFEQLASAGRAVQGHTAQAELLSAGEFGVVASAYSHSIDEARAAGAPVAWQPAVEPVIVKPAGVGITRAVRHPAAAALFVEWMLTEGQDLLALQSRIPATAGPDDALAGIELVPVDADILLRDGADWSRRYEELVD